MKRLFEGVERVKKGELLCGIEVEKEEVMNMKKNELVETIEDGFRKVWFL